MISRERAIGIYRRVIGTDYIEDDGFESRGIGAIQEVVAALTLDQAEKILRLRWGHAPTIREDARKIRREAGISDLKRVFICSPFRGETRKNITLARKLCKKAFALGCAPFAPHLIYPGFMEDVEPERGLSIGAGMAFLELCEEIWIWRPGFGLSCGMQAEVARAKVLEIKQVWLDQAWLSK